MKMRVNFKIQIQMFKQNQDIFHIVINQNHNQMFYQKTGQRQAQLIKGTFQVLEI